MKAIEYQAPEVGSTYPKTGYLFENGIFICKFSFYNVRKYFSRMYDFNDPPVTIWWGKGVTSSTYSDYQGFKSGKTVELDFSEYISQLGSYWPETHHKNANSVEVLLKEIGKVKKVATDQKQSPDADPFGNIDSNAMQLVNACIEKTLVVQKQISNPMPAYLGQTVTNFLTSTLPELEKLAVKLGKTHAAYLEVSNKLCDVTIDLTERFNKASDQLFQIPKEAYEILLKIEGLSMTHVTRGKFNLLKSTIDKKIQAQSLEVLNAVNRFNSNKNKAKEGCYIATSVYGDYDHPQVRKLRTFRDKKLNQILVGRIFVRIYYQFSPALVMRLRNKQFANTVIKSVLDKFISFIE